MPSRIARTITTRNGNHRNLAIQSVQAATTNRYLGHDRERGLESTPVMSGLAARL